MTLSSYLHYIVLFVGLGIIFFGLYLLRPYVASRKWYKSSAIIVSINESWRDVAISEYTNIKYFFPKIKYKYHVDGKTFYSDRVSHNLEAVWIPEVDVWGVKTFDDVKFWSDWLVGSTIDIYIDPNNHDSAVIINKIARKTFLNYIAIIIAGIILFLVWLGLNIIT